MARLRPQKNKGSQQGSASRSAISHRKVPDILRGSMFGRGRSNKNLVMLKNEFYKSVTTEEHEKEDDEEEEEDSGLGTESVTEADSSTQSTVVSSTNANKSSSDLKSPATSSSAVLTGAKSLATEKWVSSPMFVVAATPANRSKKQLISKSHSSSHVQVSGPVTHGSTVVTSSGAKFLCRSPSNVQVKRNIHLVATRPEKLRGGASVIMSVPGEDLQERDGQKPPPTKRRAIRRNPAAVYLKRLAHSKAPVGSRLKLFTVGAPPAFPSDEATQELPGDSSTAVMQPITSFSGIAIAATGTLSTSSPHASVSPGNLNNFLSGHSVSSVESNLASRHLIMASEDSHFEQPSNSPLGEESLNSKDVPTLSRTNSSSAISSISSSTLSPKILRSPSLSSDLTNLCGSLSLTTSSQELPTNFCAVRPFIVCNADDVSLQPCDIIATQGQRIEPDSREKFQSELAGEEKVTIFECGESSLIIDNRSVLEPCRGDKKDEAATDSHEEYLTVTPQHLAVSLDADLRSISSDRTIKLVFIKQPEQQHRARYLTEGSRGAVKDQDGSGHPILEVQGTRRPCVVQVFVGSDSGRVTPHVYYQACQVASKSISDITERCIEGTTLIEVPVTPQMDMRLVCDCVGILKERCVDVEHRRKNKSTSGSSTSSAKSRKTTKCRLVFRAIVQLPNGATEVIQIASQPISCTQPPGVPEIIRKSISQCSVSEQLEMFIIGKHFQKDAKVVFEERRPSLGEKEEDEVVWSVTVDPDPEVLHLTHLICQVPQYNGPSTTSPTIEVSLKIVSGGKHSDAHTFTYTRDLGSAAPVLPSTNITELPSELPLAARMKILSSISKEALRFNEAYAESSKMDCNKLESSSPSHDQRGSAADNDLVTSLILRVCTEFGHLNEEQKTLFKRGMDELCQLSSSQDQHQALLQQLLPTTASGPMTRTTTVSNFPLNLNSNLFSSSSSHEVGTSPIDNCTAIAFENQAKTYRSQQQVPKEQLADKSVSTSPQQLNFVSPAIEQKLYVSDMNSKLCSSSNLSSLMNAGFRGDLNLGKPEMKEVRASPTRPRAGAFDVKEEMPLQSKPNSNVTAFSTHIKPEGSDERGHSFAMDSIPQAERMHVQVSPMIMNEVPTSSENNLGSEFSNVLANTFLPPCGSPVDKKNILVCENPFPGASSANRNAFLENSFACDNAFTSHTSSSQQSPAFPRNEKPDLNCGQMVGLQSFLGQGDTSVPSSMDSVPQNVNFSGYSSSNAARSIECPSERGVSSPRDFKNSENMSTQSISSPSFGFSLLGRDSNNLEKLDFGDTRAVTSEQQNFDAMCFVTSGCNTNDMSSSSSTSTGRQPQVSSSSPASNGQTQNKTDIGSFNCFETNASGAQLHCLMSVSQGVVTLVPNKSVNSSRSSGTENMVLSGVSGAAPLGDQRMRLEPQQQQQVALQQQLNQQMQDHLLLQHKQLKQHKQLQLQQLEQQQTHQPAQLQLQMHQLAAQIEPLQQQDAQSARLCSQVGQRSVQVQQQQSALQQQQPALQQQQQHQSNLKQQSTLQQQQQPTLQQQHEQQQQQQEQQQQHQPILQQKQQQQPNLQQQSTLQQQQQQQHQNNLQQQHQNNLQQQQQHQNNLQQQQQHQNNLQQQQQHQNNLQQQQQHQNNMQQQQQHQNNLQQQQQHQNNMQQQQQQHQNNLQQQQPYQNNLQQQQQHHNNLQQQHPNNLQQKQPNLQQQHQQQLQELLQETQQQGQSLHPSQEMQQPQRVQLSQQQMQPQQMQQQQLHQLQQRLPKSSSFDLDMQQQSFSSDLTHQMSLSTNSLLSQAGDQRQVFRIGLQHQSKPVSLSDTHMPQAIQVSVSGQQQMPQAMQVSVSDQQQMSQQMQVSVSGQRQMSQQMQVSVSGQQQMPQAMQVSVSDQQQMQVSVSSQQQLSQQMHVSVSDQQMPQAMQVSVSDQQQMSQQMQVSVSDQQQMPQAMQVSVSDQQQMPQAMQVSVSGQQQQMSQTIQMPQHMSVQSNSPREQYSPQLKPSNDVLSQAHDSSLLSCHDSIINGILDVQRQCDLNLVSDAPGASLSEAFGDIRPSSAGRRTTDIPSLELDSNAQVTLTDSPPQSLVPLNSPNTDLFSSAKPSVLVGQGDPLLSQVNNSVKTWTTSTTFAQDPIDLKNLPASREHFVFMSSAK